MAEEIHKATLFFWENGAESHSEVICKNNLELVCHKSK